MPPLLKLSQKELAALYKRLFKGENKLYRSDSFPTGRFSRTQQLQGPQFSKGLSDTGEPAGIYWAKRQRDLEPLIAGYRPSPSVSPLMDITADQTAAVLTAARQKKFALPEWRKLRNVPQLRLTNKLRKDYDVIDVPDIAIESVLGGEGKRLLEEIGGTMVRQKVQLNPRSVVTKIGNKYKILGAAPIGSVAAGDMSLTEWHEYQKQRGRRNATR